MNKIQESKPKLSDENYHQYLDFIQRTIDRMSQRSASVKQWTIAIVAALFALHSKHIDLRLISIVIILIAVISCSLDGYYLMLERDFRKLFSKASIREIAPYEMNTKELPEYSCQDKNGHGYRSTRAKNWIKACLGCATFPIYTAIIAIAIALQIYAR